MNDIVQEMLRKVANIKGTPEGAFNLRVNGKSVGRENSANVSIVPKKDGNGFDMYIKPGTKGETVHIPVVLDGDGITDVVLNDFHVGENSDICIVAGCGIHNSGCGQSRHDGIHSFHIGKKARVLYKETHIGGGAAAAERVLNPVTNIYLDDGGRFEMESFQLEGVDSTLRVTKGVLAENSHLAVTEKLLTDGSQWAKTEFELDINGNGASARIVSRSVAKGESRQEFVSRITGNAGCTGHSECDAIIMDKAVVSAIPEITAAHVDASLIHEAAIGKIAGEQLVKLMTLGMTEKEAEERIISGFLR